MTDHYHALLIQKKENRVETKKPVKTELKFEEALKELENIAARLENGDLDLDESIRAFEFGMKYAKLCHDKLEEAERKVEILQKGESGEVKSKQVKVKSDTGEIGDDEELQGSLL
ncbi:MAG: exodeoxyribonuclease VII small subunit [bacterium]|nr:exodeoxyribonuclease VII small subunit [bacterium]